MAQGSQDHSNEGHFIVPARSLTNVLFALLGLTALTVITARMNLGPFAGLVAFTIAAVKAFMVMAVFMGLKYDEKSNRIIFASGFFFLALLYFFCVLDIFSRIIQNNTL